MHERDNRQYKELEIRLNSIHFTSSGIGSFLSDVRSLLNEFSKDQMTFVQKMHTYWFEIEQAYALSKANEEPIDLYLDDIHKVIAKMNLLINEYVNLDNHLQKTCE